MKNRMIKLSMVYQNNKQIVVFVRIYTKGKI